LQEGIRIGSILAFLRRASSGKVPQNVARTLQEWGAKFGQVKLSRVLLLMARDEQTMREMRASPRLQPYLGQAISPQASLVEEAKKEDLLEALYKLGYWPDVRELN